MSTVAELEQQIRAIVTKQRSFNRLIKHPPSWFQVCSALDAIGDAEFALSSFLNASAQTDKGMAYVTSAYIFAFFVDRKIMEVREIAQKIDDEYASGNG